MVPVRYTRLGSVAAIATLVSLVYLSLPSSASRQSPNALADAIAVQQSVQDYGFRPLTSPIVPPSAEIDGHEEESHAPNVADTWDFDVHKVADELSKGSEQPIGPAAAPNKSPDTSTEETSPARSKIIVTGRLESENTDWIARELPDWPSAIYYIGLPASQPSPSGLRTPVNKAREAMPYLTYILDHYPTFPDVVVFIHPHQGSWHVDHRFHNSYYMLSDLRLDTVMQRGYANLRCNNDVGCPAEIMPFREPFDQSKAAENVFADVYAHFFHATEAQMRADIPVVATQCCAQFAVSGAQLLKRPKEDYERYRQFLLDTELDDATVGRVMEYMWHMIFGRDAVHCEDDFECWCKLFGRCHDFDSPKGRGVSWIGAHGQT